MTSCFLQIYNHKWGHKQLQLLNQNATTKMDWKGLSKPLLRGEIRPGNKTIHKLKQRQHILEKSDCAPERTGRASRHDDVQTVIVSIR